MNTTLSELESFLKELRSLCGKHDVAIIIPPPSIGEIFKAEEPIRKIGELLYICEGRTGYSPRTQPR